MIVVSRRSKLLFLLLIAVQAAHSVEEYAGRLYEVFPPARFVSGLVSGNLSLGFLVINVAIVGFGAWCYFGPVRSGLGAGWVWRPSWSTGSSRETSMAVKPETAHDAAPVAFELKAASFTLPALKRERFENAGISLVESEEPRMLLDDSVLFLGEIPKQTEFEKGFPRMHYDEDGETKWDPIEDDSAIVANVKRKGLVILSGCAHSGIINTVKYAQDVTGVENVFVVMGGFHLTGADFEPIIKPTTEALKTFNPQYIVPAHCTGRKAVMHLEREMPDRFLLNMSGTKMIFAG